MRRESHVRFCERIEVKPLGPTYHPQSPWQRGTNENTNGLLRQYFPKGTDISRYTQRELDAVADALNCRPRKSLGWKSPAEALRDLLIAL
jgi:IS30 family transposase